MFELDNPIFESLRTALSEKIAEQSAAVAARNAAKGGVKAPRWKSLLSKPADQNTLEYVNTTLADISDLTINQELAPTAAHIASALYKLADYFSDQASLWATDLPSDHGPARSDDEIKKLTELCDDLYGKMIDLATPFRDNKNDPSIEQALVEFLGHPVLAKKQQDGTVRYQLDLERIRAPRKSDEVAKKLSLIVNDVPMNGENFAQEVDTAFSLKSHVFLDLLKDQLAGTGKFNTKGESMSFAHNSKQYVIKLITK